MTKGIRNRAGGRDLDEWLQAELDGDDQRADRALRRAFGHVVQLEPGPAFAASVLRAARLSVQAPPELSGWWRAAVVGCLAAAILVAAVLPVLLSMVEIPNPPQAAVLVAALSRMAARAATSTFAAWDLIVSIGTAVRVSLTSVTGVLVLVANAVMAGACLLGLRRLLAAPEEFARC